MMKTKFLCRTVFLCISVTSGSVALNAQDAEDAFRSYHDKMIRNFDDYASKVEKKCSDYIRHIWKKYDAYAPLSVPDEDFKPVEFTERTETVDIPVEEKDLPELGGREPVQLPPSPPVPQPDEDSDDDILTEFSFYGEKLKVRSPSDLFAMSNLSNDAIAAAWDHMDAGIIEATLHDCLSLGRERNLCDWAYLSLLSSVASSIFPDDYNRSTLLTAYLFGHSGYDFRMGRTRSRLYLMFRCNEEIYSRIYYIIDGKKYYPMHQDDSMSGLEICDEMIRSQRALSLWISHEQKYDVDRVQNTIHLSSDAELSVDANSHLLDFYSTYPTFRVGGNDMTRWAMYAQTPMDKLTRDVIYPQLRGMIAGKSLVEAANVLLNFVQTGFIYKNDDEVWGKDRVFFGEETLMNPYCDCDDRSVLFSHLVRDLLDLDVILIYSPGHLFTAVNFPCEVSGSCVRLGGERFVICEPTCTNGAPVGWSGVDCDSEKLKFILLEKIDYGKESVMTSPDLSM